MTGIRTAAVPKYHPTGGWDERRKHADGMSYWRNGELHRADGDAVVRDERREVWLFGHPIETPDHDPRTPLTFSGQSKTGRLNWNDSDGAIRAITQIAASGVVETRWYTTDGDPEEHWRGNYHIRRTLTTGEKRFYAQPSTATKPLLHRVDGPAVENAFTPVRSLWCVEGKRVDGPLELLIRHTVRAQQAHDHQRPIIRLVLTDKEKGRLRITVITHPESPLTTDIAVAFPDEYHEAVAAMDWY